MPQDGAGHEFLEVDNVRITYVPARDRSPGANWSGSDVLRIQAYRSDSDKSLHMGAELPVRSPDAFIGLIAAICGIYATGRRTTP